MDDLIIDGVTYDSQDSGKSCDGCAGKWQDFCVRLPACTFDADGHNTPQRFIIWVERK